MKSRILLTILVLVAMVFLVACDHGEVDDVSENGAATDVSDNGEVSDDQAATDDSDTIEVAFYNAGFLYNEASDSGIDQDVMREVANRTGLEFDYTLKPRARIWDELEAGTLSMSVSGIENEARQEFAWFTPYITQRNFAIVRKENADKYSTPEDFLADSDARISVVRGFVHGEVYDNMLETARAEGRVDEVEDIVAIFEMFEEGRADMVIALPVFYRQQLQERGLEDDIAILDWDESAPSIDHHLIISKYFFEEEDVEMFIEVFADMKNDGTLKSIFAKYLSDEEAEDAVGF